jgi:hypothetical protein
MSKSSWQDTVRELLPLMGHRNWIVITDMAYPMQSDKGITTLFTGEDYLSVLSFVFNEVQKAPHVRAHIYQDLELTAVDETAVPGVTRLREGVTQLLGKQVEREWHDNLIKKLSTVSNLFNVLVLKTTLTIPYTTIFFELDCGYWGENEEKTLRAGLKA